MRVVLMQMGEMVASTSYLSCFKLMNCFVEMLDNSRAVNFIFALLQLAIRTVIKATQKKI